MFSPLQTLIAQISQLAGIVIGRFPVNDVNRLLKGSKWMYMVTQILHYVCIL